MFHSEVTSVLLENIPLVKLIRNYIRDSSGITSEDIDDFTDIMFVSEILLKFVGV